MTIKTVLLASVLLAVGSAAQAEPEWAADVPLKTCQGFPCIDAQIGSAPAGTALIDTGDVGSVVDTAQAAAIGFDLKPQDGQLHAAYPSIVIGSATLEHAPSLALPMNDMIAKAHMPHADMTIAYSAFKDRVLQLDFVHNRLRVSGLQSGPTAACVANCAALHLITFGRKGPPIVVADGFSINGQPVTAQIDSLWSGSLLIYTASITKLGLQDAATAKDIEDFPYTDGGVKEIRSKAQTIGFAGETLGENAPLYFPTPGVHEPDALFDATVGMGLLQGHIVTLDFHAMTMTITKG